MDNRPRIMGLERLALLRGEEGRANAVVALFDMILREKTPVPASQSDAFVQKAVDLMRGLDRERKRRIAVLMAGASFVPRAMAEAMVCEDAEICATYVEKSPHIDEAVLSNLATGMSKEHARLVARRDNLPKSVIAALLARDDAEILQSLCHSSSLRPEGGMDAPPLLGSCSRESLAVLFWASAPAARPAILAELGKRDWARPLPGPFQDDANEALEKLVLYGSAKDLRRALLSLLGLQGPSAPLIFAEETGMALAAACRLLEIAEDLFTQLLIRLDPSGKGGPDAIRAQLAHYRSLSPAVSLALLRAMDPDFGQWVEVAEPERHKVGTSQRPSEAMTGFKSGPHKPVALPARQTPHVARPSERKIR